MIDYRIYWALTTSLLTVLSITFIAPSIRLKKLKYGFILVNLTIFIWNFGYFLLNLYKLQFLLKIIYVGDAFIGPAMIFFTAVYMRVEENKWLKKYIMGTFVLSTILAMTIYSRMGVYYSFKRFFIIIIFAEMISAILIILKWFSKESNSERKNNLTLLAIIYLIGIMGGATDFLPHNFGIRIFSVGNIAAAIMTLSFMFVVAKETILPKKEYIANIVTYILTFLLISTLFTIIVFSMKNRSDSFLLLSIFLASFITVIMIPIINKFEIEIIDKYLVKEKAQLEKFLKDIGNYLVVGIDETDIIGYSIFTLKDLFPKNEFCFLRFVGDFGYIKIYSTESKESQDIYKIIDMDSLETVVKKMMNNEGIYVEEMQDSELKNYLQSKNVQYIVPIEYSDFIGILGIISQQRFILSNYNEELIKNVAKSMTLSLSNVKIYRSQAENEKNSEIESMIRKIGEEYKPKLINVLNNTELIALKNYNKRESIKFLGEIKKDVIHLYNLTIDLVKYTKKHGKNKQAYNINEIIENALNIIYIPTEIKVNKKFGELPKTDVYYDELLRTFTNILSNSVEAIVDKGTIEIATRYDNINNRIIVVIEDSGSGIDSKIIQDIFSPLFTTRKENAGIGLSLAKRVIEEHGGKIQVLSKEGDGTTIRIVLPVM
ncbi:hypothetical protein DRP44_07460 [candidate division TA06 bacterium]|uniref:histidine kinase n=1 Tax=candidate division TA06 bacterium TaxID=2250710 RepID=A0A660S5Q3_UNCT6|nr:MAG: hypothetical protein DRP44_07460 [candidate division TA06 bacterium]